MSDSAAAVQSLTAVSVVQQYWWEVDTIVNKAVYNVFSARQHIAYILSALYAIARPSVCPSHGWIIQKRLKLGLWNFHHTVALSL